MTRFNAPNSGCVTSNVRSLVVMGTLVGCTRPWKRTFDIWSRNPVRRQPTLPVRIVYAVLADGALDCGVGGGGLQLANFLTAAAADSGHAPAGRVLAQLTLHGRNI